MRLHKLGMNRGQPRLWLEGKTLSEAGFLRGLHYRVTVTADSIVLELTDEPTNGKTVRKVSGKTTKHGDHPIIDMNGGEALKPFMGISLTIASRYTGCITITRTEATAGDGAAASADLHASA